MAPPPSAAPRPSNTGPRRSPLIVTRVLVTRGLVTRLLVTELLVNRLLPLDCADPGPAAHHSTTAKHAAAHPVARTATAARGPRRLSLPPISPPLWSFQDSESRVGRPGTRRRRPVHDRADFSATMTEKSA